MDPITVFSLVSSIITVVDFSKEAIEICEQLVKDGSVSKHTVLEETADSLDSAIADLDGPLDGSSREDKVLMDLCQKCRDTASVIRRQLVKLKRDGGLLDAIKKTIQSMRKSEFIEQKRRELEGYERVLNTRILVRLDAGAVQQTQMFERLLKRIDRLSTNPKDEQSNIRHRIRSQVYDSVMESLKFPEISSRQVQIPDAYRNTYEWIFEDSQKQMNEMQPKWANFTHWLKTGRGTYWIHGKAGSGKSTLMSFIEQDTRTVNALREWTRSDSTLIMPSFFFWESGTDMQKSVKGLLRSLLYQILGKASELLDVAGFGANQSYRGTELPSHELYTWTERRLLERLVKIMNASQDANVCLCFFIDGLDEFTGDIDALRDVITALSGYQNSKVCVSSRPEQAFLRFFANVPQLRLQDLTSEDIKFYVNDRLGTELQEAQEECHKCQSGLAQPHHSDSCVFDMLNEIVSKASGVFLWVRIVAQQMLSGFRNGDSISELRKRLDDLPVDIKRLYAHMLAKLPDSYIAEASTYFELLVASQSVYSSPGITLLHLALTSQQAWDSIRSGNQDYFKSAPFGSQCQRLAPRVLSRCAGLVQIDDSNVLAAGKSRWCNWETEDLRGGLQTHSPISACFREINFIHKSVYEFLSNQDAPILQMSKVSGMLLLARANLGIGFLFHELIVRDAFRKYASIAGYADFLMEALSHLSAQIADESPNDTMIEAIDEVIHFASSLLNFADEGLNPPGTETWRKRYNISTFTYAFMFFFSDKCRESFYPDGRIYGELGLWAYYGLFRSIQIALENSESSIDYSYLLKCIVLGMFREHSFIVNHPSPTDLYNIVSQCIAHGADLDGKVQFSHCLEPLDERDSFHITIATTHLTAIMGRLWSRSTATPQAYQKLIELLLSKAVNVDSPVLSFLVPAVWDLEPCLANHPIFLRMQSVKDDLIVRQISLVKYLQQFVGCATEFDQSGAASAVHPIKSLLAKGAVSSKSISFYASYDYTKYRLPFHTFYHLNEEQSSLMNSLDWLPFCDYDMITLRGQSQLPISHSVQYKWEGGMPQKWTMEQAEMAIDTIERVKSTLKEEQIIGFSSSGKFVLGDESTYLSHNPEEASDFTKD